MTWLNFSDIFDPMLIVIMLIKLIQVVQQKLFFNSRKAESFKLPCPAHTAWKCFSQPGVMQLRKRDDDLLLFFLMRHVAWAEQFWAIMKWRCWGLIVREVDCTIGRREREKNIAGGEEHSRVVQYFYRDAWRNRDSKKGEMQWAINMYCDWMIEIDKFEEEQSQ